jgi:glycosyltransferase involved in cell wall biosynthesis
LQAIDSVVNQTYKNIEIIIVDDNGKNSAIQKSCEKNIHTKYYRCTNIKYIIHLYNSGGSAARNTGIKNSRGTFISFLDDDDQWVKNKLEKQIPIINTDDKKGLVYSSVYVVEKNETKIFQPKVRGKVLKQFLSRNHIRTTSSIVCRREHLIEAGLFDENLPVRQDFDLYIRLAQISSFDFVDEPLVYFNKHNDQRVSYNDEGRELATQIIYNKYAKLYSKHPQAHSFFLYNRGKRYIQINEYYKAIRCFFKSFLIYPLNIKALFKIIHYFILHNK